MTTKTTDVLIEDVRKAYAKAQDLTKKVDSLEQAVVIANHALRDAEADLRGAEAALLARVKVTK